MYSGEISTLHKLHKLAVRCAQEPKLDSLLRICLVTSWLIFQAPCRSSSSEGYPSRARGNNTARPLYTTMTSALPFRCAACRVYFQPDSTQRCPSCSASSTHLVERLLANVGGMGVPACHICSGATTCTCEICDAPLCDEHRRVHDHFDHWHAFCATHHAQRQRRDRLQYCACLLCTSVGLTALATIWVLSRNSK